MGRPLRDNAPKLPHDLRYLWVAFIEMHRARQGGFGPLPISWSDILSYCTLMRMRLDPWEVEALRALDDAYLESVAEQQTTTVHKQESAPHG